jgi:hypothetical protein
MLTYAHVCRRMPTYADECSRVLSRMQVEPWVPEENEPSMSFEQSRLVMHVAQAGKSGQVCADVCWRMLTDAGVC